MGPDVPAAIHILEAYLSFPPASIISQGSFEKLNRTGRGTEWRERGHQW
jgi:hypothetical protein